ncbi:alpha/beta hydrolase [Gordonia neofelifaecis]|uniref:Mycolyltransferase n=1 Tax=Gordonia neofelifaecis NRRL B-59395 TaxID=644548 RepID=F1YG46_9ACTN|nr:alpha/beta hydrolase family protein [Gordonia neofelifaecis]EGD56019.1 mycolyltransferase [Gordonia neofelifaecis NRRL B-59395]
MIRTPSLKALVAAVAALAVGTAVAPLAPANAAPGTTAEIVVHSASMNRDIPVTVLLPKNRAKPAGVFYLLNGAGGGEDNANWQGKTDVVKFFANKNAYVVIPNQGAFSYYADWIKRDEKLGVNKWSTFLGKELPAAINGKYSTNGRNAIAGISSSATSVLNLAIAHRGLYRTVAAYSGCAATSTQPGQDYIRLVVETRGGADARNMWGPYNGPLWRQNDPLVNAAKLRGVSLYLSAATGLPGQYDNPQAVSKPAVLADQVVVGGVIEAATRQCTDQLASKLAALHIPATYDRVPAGTHSWRYWQDQLHKSWPQIARGIGA